ncbi:hypothetical protein VM1G_08430 [Cytospora mali]|uniref:endo-polygalacturonase n=1 Tax=Cytospora mali TaxID=578113 RepID=A0A194W8J0_CYTMA|nr:hypothetical protein VM1G_08430 [Valsa mali]
MAFKSVLIAAALVASAFATPAPMVTPAPRAEDVAKRASSCTFSGANGYASASKSQASCATIVLNNVAVPSGVTLDLSDLNDGTKVIFEGETTWGYKEWAGPLLQIKGTDITIEGASGHKLNANGDKWWDGKGSNGGKTKPKFFYAHSLKNSNINNLNIKNTPEQAVSINGCEDLTVTDMTINNLDGDSMGGHNTDGFDISESTGVTITGAKVYNQDDCVAINSGKSITFENGLCSGGHGLSIGSVGGRSDNTVETVTFSGSTVQSSVNGVRIKAKSGETGSISGITYKDITLKDISKYGILIEQNYDGGDLDGKITTGIPITGVTMSGITGTGAVDSDGYNVAIACGSGSCSNWTWSGVSVTGGKTYSCSNVPSSASCSA